MSSTSHSTKNSDETEDTGEHVSESLEVPADESHSEYEDSSTEVEVLSIGPDAQPEETPPSAILPEEHVADSSNPVEASTIPTLVPVKISPLSPPQTTRDDWVSCGKRPMTLMNDPTDFIHVPVPKKHRVFPRKWTFVRGVVQDWRTVEGDPPTLEFGESSRPPLPITGEPIEDTIPLLIARGLRHDCQIEALRSDVDEIREVAHEKQDIRSRLQILEEEVSQDNQTFSTLLARITEVESQARAASDRARQAEHRAEVAEHRAEQADQQATFVGQQLAEIRERMDSTLAFAALGVYMVSVVLARGVLGQPSS